MICIYKITNKINGKSYIGQSINIMRRWDEHLKGQGNSSLYLDFQNFCIDNFTFEILELCSKEELDEKEIYYIEKYKSFEYGYNKTLGGQKKVPSTIIYIHKPNSFSDDLISKENKTSFNIEDYL